MFVRNSLSIRNEHTTCYIHIYLPLCMVITVHMFHQITNGSKNDKVPENPDSEVIQSFLKNSKEFEGNQEVISSHS